MRRLLILSVCFVGWTASGENWGIRAANCVHSSQTFNCVEYLRNYDGDTLSVNIRSVHPLLGEQITVRVNGIDAPEIKGQTACERRQARLAQETLQRYLENSRRVNLQNVQRDKYFRVLADVVVDGKNIATEMIKRGLAVPYDGGAKEDVDWCRVTPFEFNP